MNIHLIKFITPELSNPSCTGTGHPGTVKSEIGLTNMPEDLNPRHGISHGQMGGDISVGQ